MDRTEVEAVEELAASMVDSLLAAIVERKTDIVSDSVVQLGADDGLEFDLPGDLADPDTGSEYIAEELLTRPELKAALQGVAGALLRRLKMG